MNSLIDININSINFKLRSGLSILQACELVNIIIPRFCYHEQLSIAGNCRMCLVEIEKMPKLQVSCAILISDKMIIKTNSPLVLKAREGILEFLLINHPLDCPICDQGGECDLQDQTNFYGSDKNRFKEFKKAVEDKYCGPLVKTVMTRCINCTRCTRFLNEIIGIPILGTIGRGNSIEISFYIEKLFFSELSGNVIDLCPVGALTSKPYAFLSRPWELKSIETIDIFDSIHSNIKVDVKGYKITRVLPRLNEYINEEWISDKARFSFDGLLSQRLIYPKLKDNKGSFIDVSWDKALEIIYKKMSNIEKFKKIGFVVGPFCDFESLVFLKRLTHMLNANVLTINHDYLIDSDFQNLFKFNVSFKNLIKTDTCLILGINPKTDGVLLNYHLRKRYLKGNFAVAYFGFNLNLTFPSFHIGSSINKFFSLLEGKNYFCKYLKNSKSPLIIVGKTFFNRIKNLNFNLFCNVLLSNLNSSNFSCNVLNFFNLNTRDYCFYNLCINSNYSLVKYSFDILFIIEEFKMLSSFYNSKFSIFLGHHGCLNAQKSNLVLPTSSFFEKTCSFGNFEGRLQFSNCVIPFVGSAKDSSFLLLNFLTAFTYSINCDNLKNVDYKTLLLPSISYFLNQTFDNFFYQMSTFYSFVILSNSYILSSAFDNFYKTDIISNNSFNMSKCSDELLNKVPFKLKSSFI